MAKDYTSDSLRAELKSLADTLEDVLRSSSEKPLAEWDRLRSRAESTLKDTRVRLSDTSDKVVHQTKEIASQADSYVHDNPWKGVGIGAAVGVIIGVLIAKR